MTWHPILDATAVRIGEIVRSRRMSEKPVLHCLEISHCLARIDAIVAQKKGDRRSILQLGYNLGRLSELTGLGREPFWDRWKNPVEQWDLAKLESLVQELQKQFQCSSQSPSAEL